MQYNRTAADNPHCGDGAGCQVDNNILIYGARDNVETRNRSMTTMRRPASKTTGRSDIYLFVRTANDKNNQNELLL